MCVRSSSPQHSQHLAAQRKCSSAFRFLSPFVLVVAVANCRNRMVMVLLQAAHLLTALAVHMASVEDEAVRNFMFEAETNDSFLQRVAGMRNGTGGGGGGGGVGLCFTSDHAPSFGSELRCVQRSSGSRDSRGSRGSSSSRGDGMACQESAQCMFFSVPLLASVLRSVSERARAIYTADARVARDVQSFYRGDPNKRFSRKKGPQRRRRGRGQTVGSNGSNGSSSGGGRAERGSLTSLLKHRGAGEAEARPHALASLGGGGSDLDEMSELRASFLGGRSPDAMSEASMLIGAGTDVDGQDWDMSSVAGSMVSFDSMWGSESVLEGSFGTPRAGRAEGVAHLGTDSIQRFQQSMQPQPQPQPQPLLGVAERGEAQAYGSEGAARIAPSTTIAGSSGSGSSSTRDNTLVLASTPLRHGTAFNRTAAPVTAGAGDGRGSGQATQHQVQALALRIVLLDEFLKELSAFALEHSLHIVETSLREEEEGREREGGPEREGDAEGEADRQ